jgi:hypothetical protein
VSTDKALKKYLDTVMGQMQGEQHMDQYEISSTPTAVVASILPRPPQQQYTHVPGTAGAGKHML